MDQPLKQRLIGAAVLAALAVIFLPMLLKGPDVRTPDAEEVPLTMPATPGAEFETRELPLTVPEPAPQGGVLGMDGKPRPAAPGTAPVDDTVPADAVADIAPPDGATPATPATAPPADTAPAEAPAAPAPVGAGGGDFVVTVGSFADARNAEALAAKLRAAGMPVRSDRVALNGKDGVRLRVGPYADRAAAEAARLRAQAATNVSGKVVALDGAALPPEPAAAKAPAAPAKPEPAKPTATSTAATPPVKPAAPAPAPQAPPSSGGAPATVTAGFAVQLSAPSVEADANALRDKARAAGFPSFVQRIEAEGGTRWRVRIGPFADRGAADAARDAANGKLGTHGIVMRHP